MAKASELLPVLLSDWFQPYGFRTTCDGIPFSRLPSGRFQASERIIDHMPGQSWSVLGSKTETGKRALHNAPVTDDQNADRRHKSQTASSYRRVVLRQTHQLANEPSQDSR